MCDLQGRDGIRGKDGDRGNSASDILIRIQERLEMWGKYSARKRNIKTQYFEYLVWSDSRQGREGESLSDEANIKKPKKVRQQNINS